MPLESNAAKSGDGGEEIPGYSDLTLVGRGGFGVVYRARQEHPSRDVAIKILASPSIDETVLSRFQRECELTGRLTGHPNVVTVLDTGITRSGRPYVVTEYFAFGSLKKRLDEGGPFSAAEVLRIGVKIAGALAAAHEAKILHRDVKPQNILVSRFGEPALADFGIARLLDSEEVSTRGDVLTPYHVAPEVLDDQSPSPASDTYSLASTLYQLLAGEPAFKRGTNEGIAPVLRRVLLEDPPEISRGDVPAQVTALIRRCMAKSPQERIGDPLAFASALQRVQGELGYGTTELPGTQAIAQPGAPGTGTGTGTSAGPGLPSASTWPTGAGAGSLEDTGSAAVHDSVTPPDPGSSMTVHRPHRKHTAGEAKNGSAKRRPWRVIAVAAVSSLAVAGAAYGVYAMVPAGAPDPAAGRQPVTTGKSTAPPTRSAPPPAASSAAPEHNSSAPTAVPEPPEETSAEGERPPRPNRPAGKPCIPENPADRPSQKYCVWVDTYADATGYSAPNRANPQGTVFKGRVYVFCKVWGAEMREGGDFNHWWLKTDLDKVNPGKNATAYISAFYLARWGNDVAKDNDGNAIPNC